MANKRKPAVPDELLDQLLDGSDALEALQSGKLVQDLKKALALPLRATTSATRALVIRGAIAAGAELVRENSGSALTSRACDGGSAPSSTHHWLRPTKSLTTCSRECRTIHLRCSLKTRIDMGGFPSVRGMQLPW